MDKLFGDLRVFNKDKKNIIIDSFIYRLHYKLTMVLLIAFSIIVTGRQYVGDPIQCISKDDIPEDLLKTYCWVHTTFSLPKAWNKTVGVEVPYPGIDKHLPGEKVIYHAYYQWVCFMLFIQAALFYIPRYLWKNVEAHRMYNLVDDLKKLFSKNRPLYVEYLLKSKGHHHFYSYFYIFTCTLNFINVLGQIYLMDIFLGGEFTTYGLDVVRFTEWDWTIRNDPMLRVFPRMTKCTFHRFGSSGDVQKHDAMCLLPINIVNEKIYVFLWFWFVVLAVMTGVELVLKVVTFVANPVRIWIFRYRCPKINQKHLMTITNNIDYADYIVLSLLCKNVDGYQFKPLMEDFAKEIEKNLLRLSVHDDADSRSV